MQDRQPRLSTLDPEVEPDRERISVIVCDPPASDELELVLDPELECVSDTLFDSVRLNSVLELPP